MIVHVHVHFPGVASWYSVVNKFPAFTAGANNIYQDEFKVTLNKDLFSLLKY